MKTKDNSFVSLCKSKEKGQDHTFQEWLIRRKVNNNDANQDEEVEILLGTCLMGLNLDKVYNYFKGAVQ